MEILFAAILVCSDKFDIHQKMCWDFYDGCFQLTSENDVDKKLSYIEIRDYCIKLMNIEKQ